MNSLQGQMTSVLSTDALAASIAAAVNASLQENAVLAGLWAEQQEITDAVAATVDEISVAQGLALNALKVDLVEAIKGVPALVEAEAAERDKGPKALDKKLSDFQAEVEKQLKVVDELPDQVSASVDDALKPLAAAVTIIDRIKLTYQADPKVPVYRWNHWWTYDQSFSWYDGNDPRSFGGVHPSQWTNGNHRAWDMNKDWKYLRRFFVRKGFGHEYGSTVCSECYFMYSSTTGRMCGTIFRIKNVAPSAVGWNPEFMYTSWSGWEEDASASMNGASNWRHHCGGSFCRTNINFNVPASDGPGGRISTIVFVTGGTTPYHVGYNRWERANILMFNDNALKLPNGLEYVDDMDTMTGSWKD